MASRFVFILLASDYVVVLVQHHPCSCLEELLALFRIGTTVSTFIEITKVFGVRITAGSDSWA
jgi:hypothetical protein